MSLYLDTSVLVPLQIEEPKSEILHQWLAETTDPLCISDLAVAEFGSALSRYVRMDRLPADAAKQALANFDQWVDDLADRVENLPVDIRLASQLVRTPLPKLLTPDAIHIATCRRLGLTLVAHDTDMVDHATRLGVKCRVP